MEPEGSLPHSQQPATCPYPEPDQSSPCPTSHYLKIHFNIIPHTGLGLPSVPFRSGLPTKTLHTPLLSPIPATCPAHLILLDLFTRTIFGEQYRSLSSSLCNFLHSPVTSSLLGPNILLSTLFSETPSQVSHPYKRTSKIIVFLWCVCAGTSSRAVSGAGLQPLGCSDCGFESRRGINVCRVVCCQTEVSATVRSLVQRSPTECGASLCDLETSRMWRRWAAAA